MSTDRHPRTFSRQIEAIVYIATTCNCFLGKQALRSLRAIIKGCIPKYQNILVIMESSTYIRRHFCAVQTLK